MTSSSTNLFHADHPRRIIPELSSHFHQKGWFNGTGFGGFISIKQGDSIYLAPSNAVKNRLDPNDLFVYKVSDGSVSLSPDEKKKLQQCEILNLIMVIFKEVKNVGAVLHTNGKEPCLSSLVYTGGEFRIKNQAALRGIYNDGLERCYNMDEELVVPIINHATEAEIKGALKKYPHTTALIIRNQGCFVWAGSWQKCQFLAESYHQLMEVSVQMEKLGLNVYTHSTTSNDIIAMNNSINSEAASATTQQVTEKSPKKEAPKEAEKSPSKVATSKETKSPLKKIAEGKVTKKGRKVARGATKAGAKARGALSQGSPARFSPGRGRGGRMKQSPAPNGMGFNPMMMGPGPMGPGPMGPGPMGPGPMGPGPMGPPVMPMMGNPMMGPPQGGRGRGGKRGKVAAKQTSKRGGRGGRGGRSKTRGMAKQVLMNY